MEPPPVMTSWVLRSHPKPMINTTSLDTSHWRILHIASLLESNQRHCERRWGTVSGVEVLKVASLWVFYSYLLYKERLTDLIDICLETPTLNDLSQFPFSDITYNSNQMHLVTIIRDKWSATLLCPLSAVITFYQVFLVRMLHRRLIVVKYPHNFRNGISHQPGTHHHAPFEPR